jgi:epoxyqueuosine reductase
MGVNETLRKLAKAQGFARVGFCRADPPATAPMLAEYLAQGRHGTMDWLARNPEWRADIRTRYPWAQSYLMLSIDYPAELPRLPDKSVIPMIARYARGRDYHEVYEAPLLALEKSIKASFGTGTKALWYQDTGPFLERALAQQAGLGWVGKNTMLIDPARGSWTLLALVVTSLEVEPDTPVTDHCGTCTRCLDACPTKAFPAPYQLDASRCISYLNIEHEGAVPEPLREPMGQWLVGCDICNEVCPWNSKAPKAAPELTPDYAGLTLSRILTGKPDQLRKRIDGTPLVRVGVDRLRRNAAVVAGNLRDPSLIASLEQAAHDDDRGLRECVYWALRQYPRELGRGPLARAQKYEVEDDLRDQIIETLQTWV